MYWNHVGKIDFNRKGGSQWWICWSTTLSSIQHLTLIKDKFHILRFENIALLSYPRNPWISPAHQINLRKWGKSSFFNWFGHFKFKSISRIGNGFLLTFYVQNDFYKKFGSWKENEGLGNWFAGLEHLLELEIEEKLKNTFLFLKFWGKKRFRQCTKCRLYNNLFLSVSIKFVLVIFSTKHVLY